MKELPRLHAPGQSNSKISWQFFRTPHCYHNQDRCTKFCTRETNIHSEGATLRKLIISKGCDSYSFFSHFCLWRKWKKFLKNLFFKNCVFSQRSPLWMGVSSPYTKFGAPHLIVVTMRGTEKTLLVDCLRAWRPGKPVIQRRKLLACSNNLLHNCQIWWD